MKVRIAKPIFCALLCCLSITGCATLMVNGEAVVLNAPLEIIPVETGFVDLGGFFTEGQGAGTILPFEPEAEDEVATDSFFAARSIDPFSEDSAGPKFVVSGDIDGDGLPDLATVWNQSQVVQIQLQRRDTDGRVFFDSVQIDGTAPLAIMAGIELADIDQDGGLDIILLVKHNAALAICPGNGTEQPSSFVGEVVILFAPPGDVTIGGDWLQVRLTASVFGANKQSDAAVIEAELEACEEAAEADCIVAVLADCLGDPICAAELCDDAECGLETREILLGIDDNFPGPPFGTGRAIDVPENGGMNALAVGDINGDNFPDIMITSNVASPPCHNGINEVELYPNPGAAASRDGLAWNQIILNGNSAILKDIVLNDIDGDGDLDLFVTRSNAISRNVYWLENPSETGVVGPNWAAHPVGQVDTGADVMTVGDIDGDGFDDVVLRSNGGRVIQWFRHPSPDDELDVTDVLADIPWSVYTLFELSGLDPRGIALGDINFDGQLELILAAEGSVFWIDSSTAPVVFDQWSSNLIVDDAQLDTSLFAASGPAFINDVLVLDLDCDGAQDVIATVDRRSQSGLSTDVVVWFRNILTPEDVGLDQELVPGCP